MSFPTEPTVPLPTWATDSGSIKVDPGDTKRALGWEYAGVGLPYGEAPPFPWVNNELYNNGEWATYFKAVADYIKNNPPIPPTRTVLSFSGTYTLPTTPRKPVYLRVQFCGAGGGGQGGGAGGSNGSDGTLASFKTTLGSGTSIFPGKGGTATAGGLPGGFLSSPGPDFNTVPIFSQTGQQGQRGFYGGPGGAGGGTAYGNGGFGGVFGVGQNGDYSGGGGGGGYIVEGATPYSFLTGSGGGSGAYIEFIITNPQDSYIYVRGDGGAGGTPGVAPGSEGTAYPGGSGGNSHIVITEYYQ